MPYRIECRRRRWGIWLAWRPWNGDRQRYADAATAQPYLDLLQSVWPTRRFRIAAVKEARGGR